MPSAPARDRRAGVAGVDAADRDQRQRAPRAAPRASPSAPTGPPASALVGGRGERAVRDVVDGFRIDRADLIHRVERDAEDRVGTEQRARRGGRQVALADVAAGGARRERDVDPVVDDQRHAQRRRAARCSARACSSSARPPAALSRSCTSVTPPWTARRDDLGERPPAALRRVGHQIEARIEAPARHAIRTPAPSVASSSAASWSTIRTRRLPGPADLGRRALAGEAEERERARRGGQRIGLDRQERADHGARRAAERGHPGHRADRRC